MPSAKNAAPKRLGQAVRKLARGTAPISIRVARELYYLGVVKVGAFDTRPALNAGPQIKDPKRNTIYASLTLKGWFVALLVLVGLNPYKFGRHRPDCNEIDQKDQKRREAVNRHFAELCAAR
jgi:hypothetical protein